jgi:hypothetical protein
MGLLSYEKKINVYLSERQNNWHSRTEYMVKLREKEGCEAELCTILNLPRPVV